MSWMYAGPSVNYPLFVPVFSATINILDKITKNIQISNLMKIRPVVAMRTDWHTDKTKLVAIFRSFF